MEERPDYRTTENKHSLKEHSLSTPLKVILITLFFYKATLQGLLQLAARSARRLCGQKMPGRFFPQMIGLAVWWSFLIQSPIYFASASYRRHVPTAEKRQNFLERTLILLDVNTRSPVRVLNDNFLSLQVDPSILKNGWLDFLRYPILTALCTHTMHKAIRHHCSNASVFIFCLKKKKSAMLIFRRQSHTG